MEVKSPYKSPASNIIEAEVNEEVHKTIDSLDLSEKWKDRFHAIAAVGGPQMPLFKEQPKDVRQKALSFNILAFLFGPIYYAFKGMWKRGFLMFTGLIVVIFVIAMLLELIGYGQINKYLGYGVAAIFALRANVDYYKKMVLNDNGWF